jgi:hypothetical protein
MAQTGTENEEEEEENVFHCACILNSSYFSFLFLSMLVIPYILHLKEITVK